MLHSAVNQLDADTRGIIMMSGPPDRQILEGEMHVCSCGCGARWSDSDGNAPHWKCDKCGEWCSDDVFCGCTIVGIPLSLLRRCEGALMCYKDREALWKELHAEIDEMRGVV